MADGPARRQGNCNESQCHSNEGHGQDRPDRVFVEGTDNGTDSGDVGERSQQDPVMRVGEVDGTVRSPWLTERHH